MRIAILLQSYGRFGGAERLTLAHYQQAKQTNADTTLFYDGKMSQRWLEKFGDNEIRPIPSCIIKTPSKLREIIDFVKRLRDFDKIVIHHHVEPVLAFYLSRILGHKTVWYSGSVFELPWETSITGKDYRSLSPTVKKTSVEFYGGFLSGALMCDRFYNHTVRFARVVDVLTVRGFHKIIANSAFLSGSLVRTYKLKEPPRVVYPGPDPELERLSSLPRFGEKDYILAVGSLIPLKNVETIIRAAATIPSARIVLVGDGQERSRLKDLGAKCGVSVEFRGAELDESELARAYSECKLLVHLSLYEPFGLTAVEAALFAKPAIVTNRGGPPEIVQDGITGYVVDPLDCESVRSRMKQLLFDNELRRQMGERARKYVVKKFTLKQSVNGFLDEVEM